MPGRVRPWMAVEQHDCRRIAHAAVSNPKFDIANADPLQLKAREHAPTSSLEAADKGYQRDQS